MGVAKFLAVFEPQKWKNAASCSTLQVENSGTPVYSFNASLMTSWASPSFLPSLTAEVEERGVLLHTPGGELWDSGVFLQRRLDDLMGVAKFLAVLECTSGPASGHEVIAFPVVLKQVHADRAELQRSAALQEEDLVVVRNAEELPEVCLCILDDLLELLRSVGHLHHAHSSSVPVEKLVLGLLEHFFGQAARSGREIVHSVGGFH
eukprot:CAMPEP_0168350256 /NCGR_PEP_ID=MMETSP0213-20121227/20994_1 /TAXON_ID=151035 /ORGANISM="Euplotes harpa, Strain FSP1.4" /LENGTH=205 /DNA_ID=CAMNT_0008360535 /DNA_START=696 /DNA_END=1314 /DNA_ORIENTATION=+